VVFYLHDLVSEFGMNWGRPILLIVTLTFIVMGFGVAVIPDTVMLSSEKLMEASLISGKKVCVINKDTKIVILSAYTKLKEVVYCLLEKLNINSVESLTKLLDLLSTSHPFWSFLVVATIASIITFIFNLIFRKIFGKIIRINFIIITLILIALYVALILLTEIGVWQTLDQFAITLNIFNLFSRNEVKDCLFKEPLYPFVYTLYVIFIAILVYQTIVAVRRWVRR